LTFHILKEREKPSLVSLVVPCYNEELSLPFLKKELVPFVNSFPHNIEVVFINDGSSDKTLEFLFSWCTADPSFKLISFARNFGHQAAVTAGMDAAKGDAVIIIDADLQDPLEAIYLMLAKYQEGYDIVYGQRESREGESWFKLFTAWAFYRTMKKFIHKDLPLDTGDFRLIARNALNCLNSMRELHRFLRGMGAWVGFAQCPVKYKRNPRSAGETKYPFSKMVRFAWNGAVSFSPLPLKAALGLGFFTALVGVVVGIYALLRGIQHYLGYLPGDSYNSGWASLITLLCLVGGTILMCLGILGEYVGRIFEEIKGRPLYVVREKVNF
jgi:polyisoprenyl-phosphate glycosyltransferase